MATPVTKLRYTWTEIASTLLRDSFLPGLQNVIESASQGSWLLGHVKRRSDIVKGLYAQLKFRTRRSSVWRPVGPLGVFPSIGKTELDDMAFRLAMHGAGIQITMQEMEALEKDNAWIPDLMADKMEPVYETFPTYLMQMLWSPQSGILGQASGSEASLAVALDNAGSTYWNTKAGDRCKFLEDGQYIQWYDGVTGEQKGDPVQITYVDVANDTIYLAESRGIVDNDWFVVATVDGLEDGYYPNTDADADEGSPGIYDLLSASNTFQGVDRSVATNAWARATIKNMAAAVPSRSAIKKWLRDCKNPTTVHTAPEVLDYFYVQLFNSTERYVGTKSFRDGFEAIKIEQTDVVATPDGLIDSLDSVDFDNCAIAQTGDIRVPFDRGWYQLERQPVAAHDFAWFGRFVMTKPTKKFGRYHNFIITNTIAS